jgi:hypothetical protein
MGKVAAKHVLGECHRQERDGKGSEQEDAFHELKVEWTGQGWVPSCRRQLTARRPKSGDADRLAGLPAARLLKVWLHLETS